MKRFIPFTTVAFFVLLGYLLLSILACNDDESVSNEGQILFLNGNIYTVNDVQPWASAVLVEDGVITYVGTDEGAESRANDVARVVDLNGKMMMPGIHDVHIHPIESASDNTHFTLDEFETDPENYTTAVAAAHQANTGTGWLIGYGHSIFTLLDATRPPKEILDDVVPNRPVIIMEQTSHSMWVNSEALNRLGITADTPDPVGGIILRDATTDERHANGILIDNAGNEAMDVALMTTQEILDRDYDGLVEFMLPELAKHGITSICDARTYWKRDHHHTWKKVEEDGNLTVRVNLGLWAYPSEEDARQIATLKSLYSNDPNRLLKINQIKFYSDGIVHNTTAAMQTDYLIDLFGGTTNNGLNYFTQSRLVHYLTALEPTGFDFHIHAIGNRGITESLNAIEQGGTAKGRHRLTHVEIVSPTDYNRFAALDVTADCQVAGDFTKPSHWSHNNYLIGAANAMNLMPLKNLQAANARITLSSDYSVSHYNPFIGLQNAVTRLPQELSLAEAIKAYTINAAYVMRQETKVGSIEVGKEADLIVLSQNLFEIAPNQITQTVVERTYLQGVLIYER